MAVRAHDLALLDLLEDALPVPVRQRVADVEGLVVRIHVIELEGDGIVFSTIRAGMAGEVLEQVGGAPQPESLLPGERLIDIALFVRQIVLPVIGGSAWPAHVVELQSPLPSPSELGTRLALTAPTTSPKDIPLSHDRTDVRMRFGRKLA
jgi:hypothetical protein